MHAERFAPCRRPVKRFSNLRRSASGHELSRPISLFGLKSSAGGAPITARRAERRIKMAVAQLRLLRIGRALPLTEDSPSRDEIPEFAHIFFIESRLAWPAKKRPQLREKSWGPGGASIRIGSTRRMNDACCACAFHPTPQLASPRQGLRAGALYYPFFKGHLNRINRSCAVASSASDQDLAKSDHLLPRRKRAESHRNKTIAGLVS